MKWVTLGYEGPWTDNPFDFDNSYYVDLLKKTWTPSKSSVGKDQFADESKKLMMVFLFLVYTTVFGLMFSGSSLCGQIHFMQI